MRRLLVFGVALASVAGLMSLPAAAVTTHCPGGWIEKIEAVGSELNDDLLDPGTTFCIKAGTSNTGILDSDDYPGMTLFQILQELGIRNGGGQTPGVSYLVIYEQEECHDYSCEPPSGS